MAKFKDADGREWAVRVDVTGVRHVREIDVDLGDISKAADNMLLFANDPCILCNVLFVLCEDQAKARNVSDEDFGRLLAGDVIYEATVALEEATINFFPPQKRSLLQRLRKKVDLIQEKGADLVAAKLDDPDLETKILASMKTAMDNSMNTSLTQLNSATS